MTIDQRGSVTCENKSQWSFLPFASGGGRRDFRNMLDEAIDAVSTRAAALVALDSKHRELASDVAEK
jgi:hypothetical protein